MTDPIEEPETWVTCSPRRQAAATPAGWIEPTPDQMEGARRLLNALPEPDGFALKYVGSILKRLAAGDFGADDIRRAVAMYRVWDEEVAK